MDTRVESLRLLIGGRITTVDVVTAEHADGLIWDTVPVVDSRAREDGDPSSELAPLFAQFDLEDQALTSGGAAPPLEVLLDRVEALLR